MVMDPTDMGAVRLLWTLKTMQSVPFRVEHRLVLDLGNTLEMHRCST